MSYPLYFRHKTRPLSDAIVIRHDSETETWIQTRNGDRAPMAHWCVSCSLLMVATGKAVPLSAAEARRMMEDPKWD